MWPEFLRQYEIAASKVSNSSIFRSQDEQNISPTKMGVVTGILRDFERKHLSLVAAGLVYYFLLSLLPALLLLTSLATLLPVQNGVHGLISFISPIVPPHAMSFISQLLQQLSGYRAGLISFAVLTALWLTSVATKGIIAGLDIVYEVRTPRRIWTNRVLAVALTFGIGMLLVGGVLLTLVGPLVERLLSRAISVQSLWIALWPSAHWILSATFIFAAIELLYLFAPNVPASLGGTTIGASIATLMLLALARGLGWSFYRFGASNAPYSLETLALPIAVAVWLHWCAQIVLLGAEINMNIHMFKESQLRRQQRSLIDIKHSSSSSAKSDAA